MSLSFLHPTEVLLFATVALHVFLAPGTKVEESFNIQAIHDLIYHSWNVSAYDHLEFSGVVPRTFAGPAFLAAFGYPARLPFIYLEIPKYWMQVFVRCVLGFTVALSVCNFGRALRKWYGDVCATSFRFITISQFHFLYYASRTLPNTFALPFVIMVYQRIMDSKYYSAVKWATAAAVLFRFELVLLFGPIFILAWFQKHIIFFDFEGNGAIFVGIQTALQILVSSIPLDTLLWQRPVYPEWEVIKFNVIENRSHEYGVMPLLWYFYNALPRCMLTTLILAPLSILVDRFSYKLIIPSFAFLFLYSFLPHKELRFILYVVPALNAAAAIFISKMYFKSGESIFWKLIYTACRLAVLANVMATILFTYASVHNYPSWDALKELQEIQQVNSLRPISIHIDVASAQTGVTRFMQLYDNWEYNKTENLLPDTYGRFDFMMVGTYKDNLREIVNHHNYSSTHQLWFTKKGFSHIEWIKLANKYNIPIQIPSPVFAERVAVLKKL